jgi:predicted transcriptional regulator
MKVARARVVSGAVVTRAKFPEVARLTILMEDDCPAIELDTDEEEGILRGLADAKAGRTVSLDRARAKLHRRM